MELRAAKTQKTYYYYRTDKESQWIRLGEKEYFSMVEKHKQFASKIEKDEADIISYISYDSPNLIPDVEMKKTKGCFGLFVFLISISILILLKLFL